MFRSQAPLAASTITVNDIVIDVTRKHVKHIRLSVRPPDGRVRISAPTRVPIGMLRDFAESKLDWIRRQQTRIRLRTHTPTPEELERERHMTDQWCREQLRAAVPALMETWARTMNVTVSRWYMRRMKTRWGSCNPRTRAICLNTELAKRPAICLEYVLVHELVHLLEPSHNARFVALMNRFMPEWKTHRDVLNRRPMPARNDVC